MLYSLGPNGVDDGGSSEQFQVYQGYDIEESTDSAVRKLLDKPLLPADEQEAIDGARMWKATQLEEVYKEEIPDPADMLARADQEISDDQFAKEGFLVGADPEDQITRIREMEEAGATVVCLQCIGADPLGSIERYGQHVLPALRGARV